jgi:predicted RNase H-like HicB family nuclease
MSMEFLKYDSMLRPHLVRREMCTDGIERWAAWFPDLPGCRSQSNVSDSEAVEMLYDLLPKYVEALKAIGVSPEMIHTVASHPTGVTATLRAVRMTTGTSTGAMGHSLAVPA